MKPIMFCNRSVLAWQQGAKTQTRRLVKPQPEEGQHLLFSEFGEWQIEKRIYPGVYVSPREVRQPYAVGDLLWIREPLIRSAGWVGYSADGNYADGAYADPHHHLLAIWPWKRDKLPAMFMPKWACRYHAKVVSVRPEQLRDITDEDAEAEGVSVGIRFPTTWYVGKSRNLYFDWWDSLHKKSGVRSEDNPWVWIYQLENTE